MVQAIVEGRTVLKFDGLCHERGTTQIQALFALFFFEFKVRL
jgi:hypothetical protein